jgi:hypothetical protein
VLRARSRAEHAANGVEIVRVRPDEDRRRGALGTEQFLGDRQADERRAVEIGGELERVQDPDDGEPLVAEPDAHPRPVDPQPLGGDRAEHDGRVARARGVQEDPGPERRAERCREVEAGGGDADPTRLHLGDEVGAPDVRVERLDGRDVGDRADPADHGGRLLRELRVLAEDRLARADSEEVRAEAVEGRDQVRLRRLRDREHGHHRRDSDRDPERRKGRPQAARSEADAADPQHVGREEA